MRVVSRLGAVALAPTFLLQIIAEASSAEVGQMWQGTFEEILGILCREARTNRLIRVPFDSMENGASRPGHAVYLSPESPPLNSETWWGQSGFLL